MRKFILLIILFTSINLFAQKSTLKKVDSIVNSKTSENDPSIFVGIVKDGNIIYEKYRGLVNLQHQVNAHKESRSNIASTAKQFTALMVLQLSLEQKLGLNDDIREYLPKLYPAIKEKISIRHLLNHTSGIRDYADLLSIQQKPWWKQVGMDNDDVIELLKKQEELGFTPGSRYMYSNSGYTILTKIIEKSSGQKFHIYSKKFFEELGMNETIFSNSYMNVIPNQAQPYSDWGNGIWKQYPMLTKLNGDGFLYTTLKDQLIFEQAIQNAKKNHNILLIDSQKPIPNSEIKTYGFGLELEERLNYKAVHHSGSTGSYHSQVIRFPDEKLTVFVMSTNSRIWSGAIADEISGILLPEKEAIVNYNEQIKNIQGNISKENLAGQYLSQNGVIVRIQLKEGKIYWKKDNNNPFQIQQEKGSLYSIRGNSTTKIGFEINKNNKNTLTVFWPNSKKRIYKKIAPFQPNIQDLEAYVGEYFSKELDVSFTISLNKKLRLMLQLKNPKKAKEVEIINKNDLLFSDYRMKVLRDQFNRITGIALTTNRVLNNKFIKKTNLKFQPKITTSNGSIQVTTIGSKNGNSQILLTKNYANGNEIWSKQFGGKSYDKASSIIATKDGYLIIGSTSSYGKGNYDMFLVKTDKEGRKLWQKTYGNFYNDYGYSIEKVDNGYLLKGTTQNCTSNTDVFNRKCTKNAWFVSIDENGKEFSNNVLEKLEN
jgi:CubicO group peptidase (beta-lactamase class C family)